MEPETPEGFVPVEKYQRLVTKYNTLHQRYRDFEAKHAKWRAYIKKADEQYAIAKERTRQWNAWIERHGLPTAERQEQNLPEPGNAPSKDSTPKNHDHSTHQVTSSQTTEGEQEPPAQIDDSSDFEPEVVSTRSVKRKRSGATRAMPPPVRVKQEPTSPDEPIDLISEDHSSPSSTRTKVIRNETSDLDAFVGHHNTPRKPKRRRAASEEVSRPSTFLRNTSSLSEGDVLDEKTHQEPVKTEEDANATPSNHDVTARDFALPPMEQAETSNVLRQLSNNIPSVPRKKTSPSEIKQKREFSDEYLQKLALVSEDGEDLTSQPVASRPQHTPQTHASSRRLDALLEGPTPNTEPLPKRRTPDTAPRGHQNTIKPSPAPIPKPQFKRPRGLSPSPPPTARPEEEPLRSRKPQDLHLADFRINPHYLGTDFAFADTLRGRDQRRCLPSCTQPDCCGNAFRKAVEMGGGAMQKKSEADLLEDYLGPHWRQITDAYSSDNKRKDVVVQARAHAFAKQHGKHRAAFERRRTPPGFWRTDMPTTQEEAEDRARAGEMERGRVEERWREAMRPGGRWVFRDEVVGTKDG